MFQSRYTARRFEVLVVACAAVSVLATAVVVMAPDLRLAYRSVPVHVAIETAAALVAALAAVLLGWRFVRARRLPDLALVCAFASLALVDVFRALDAESLFGGSNQVGAWPAFVGSLVGLGLFVVAAFLRPRTLPRSRRALRWSLSVTLLVLVAAGFAAALAGDALPAVVDLREAPEFSRQLSLDAPPLVLALLVLMAGLLGLAAMGFIRQAQRDEDNLRCWLAVAAVFAAASRINYALFPSFYAGLVYTGDIFRLAFYIAVLVGALSEIAAYQPRLAAAAVLDERRRVARDLHDGLAQELAYIGAQAATLRERGDDRREIVELELAAGRALDESRLAISALVRPPDDPLDEAVASMARSIAARGGVRVALDVQPGVEAQTLVKAAALRILAEAMTNALRHGRPSVIAVKLRADQDLQLAVADDGSGFDQLAERSGAGFGLTTMRERAEVIGGRMKLRSVPGQGTTVEAVLPLIR